MRFYKDVAPAVLRRSAFCPRMDVLASALAFFPNAPTIVGRENLLSQMQMGASTRRSLDLRRRLRLGLEHVRNRRCLSAVRNQLGRHAMSCLQLLVATRGLVSRVGS
jgi:hypothetical protein